jgi:hypothetical protein
MKLQSEGKTVLEIDEDKIKKVSNGDGWKYEMLKQMTKVATLMEVSCTDHREIKLMLSDNAKVLAKIATVTGVLLALLTGAAVVI